MNQKEVHTDQIPICRPLNKILSLCMDFLLYNLEDTLYWSNIVEVSKVTEDH